MQKSVLLFCGLAASLLYVAADVAGTLSYPGYSYSSQAISELAAIGAPSHLLMLILWSAYNGLVIAFGFGVATMSYRTSGLRRSSRLFVALGLVGAAALFFPMHGRGDPRSLTDSVHIALTVTTTVLIVLAVGFASGAFGKGFRAYSLATILAMLVFGAFAAMDGPNLAAGRATQFLGVNERIDVGAWLLWVAVLAVRLIRAERRDEPLPELAQAAG